VKKFGNHIFGKSTAGELKGLHLATLEKIPGKPVKPLFNRVILANSEQVG
jgi:hypothetical protein